MIHAEVRLHRGALTVFVDGTPIDCGAVLYRNRGPDGYFPPPSLGVTTPALVKLYDWFVVGGDMDFSRTFAWFDSVFVEHPQAYGALHVGLDPSREWAKAHPDDMPAYDEQVDWDKPVFLDGSRASGTWRKDSSELVESLVRALHERYNGRVILYQVGAGACWENGFYINPGEHHLSGALLMGDFSPPMRDHFRRRLREYYRGDVESLRRAWSDRSVTFETAEPPDRMERMRTEWFTLRSPLRAQAADFNRAWAEALEDCVLAWCAAVKRGSDRHALAASPLAPILDTGLFTFMDLQLMKSAFARALASPDMDMFQSPASYCHRDPGRGDTSAMIPLGTLRLAGKMWLRDFDSRTSLAPTVPHTPHGYLFKTPANPWEDVEILKRDAGYSLLKGGGYWLHEIVRDMFRLPEHQKVVRRIQAIGRGLVHAGRGTAPGLAVFVDPESNFHQASANRLIYAMNYEARQLHWAHAGMANEVYCLNDAGHPDMPAHKVLMVTNAFCLTDAQGDSLKSLARRNRGVLIWLMAPGVQTPHGFDLDHTSDITGFRIRSFDAETLPRITLRPGSHPWSHPPLAAGGALGGFGGGPGEWDGHGEAAVGPTFYADVAEDSGVTVLGVLDAINKPGLVVRERDGYTSVYCAAPCIHNALLRAMGKSAGAHVYLDTDDLVHAAGNLLLVHAARPGTKQIHWPNKAEAVIELYAGRRMAENSNAWQCKMALHETRLFCAGPRKMLEAVRAGSRLSARRAMEGDSFKPLGNGQEKKNHSCWKEKTHA